MGEPFADEQLSAYLDGDLTDMERVALEERLAAEDGLRAELAQLQEAVQFLRAHGPVQAPDDFLGAVLEQVASEPMPESGGFWAWLKRPFGMRMEGIVLVAAAAAVLFVAMPQATKDSPMEDAMAPPPAMELEVEEERAEPAAAVLPAAPDDGSGGAGGSSYLSRKLKPAPKKQEPREESRSVGSGKKQAVAIDPFAQVAADEADAVQEEAGGAPIQQQVGSGEEKGDYYSVPFSFVVKTADPDALLRLQQLAGRHAGRVLDTQQQQVQTATLEEGLSEFLVEIPGTSMSAFQAELERLGTVVRYDSAQGLYPSEGVMIKVDLQLTGAPGKKSAKPSPKTGVAD